MRDRRDWMNKATYPVLELLDRSDVALSQAGTTVNLKLKLTDAPNRKTIRTALEELESRGYVELVGEHDNYYRITEAGRGFLREQGEDGE